MAEQSTGGGREAVGRMAKKALAPIVHSAVTAGTAYLTRKAMQTWQKKLLPKIEERGGGRAVARKTLATAAEKVGGPASEKISSVADKLGGEDSARQPAESTGSSGTLNAGREAERRRREKRRNERRRALEQSGST